MHSFEHAQITKLGGGGLPYQIKLLTDPTYQWRVDDLCESYVELCFDNLYFTIQTIKKYSAVICYFFGGRGAIGRLGSTAKH